MKEPLFNIEVFNQKTTKEKIDYLFNCLHNIPEKRFNESHSQHISKLKAKSDLDKPEAADMKYMLDLMRKYNSTGKEDHLIINDYNAYMREIKLNQILC
jgi:hypothetical protein